MPLKNSTLQNVPVAGAVALAATAPLPVPVIWQEQDEWCWAACIVMALRYYGDGATEQCQLAAALTGKNGCCADPLDCNIPCEVDHVQPLYDKVGLLATGSLGVPAFGDLESQFAASCPVEVATSVNAAGHALIVTWAGLQDGQPHILLNDPEPPATVLWSYSELTSRTIATWTGIAIEEVE
jgi:Papain-like cysteine protease AvrRpt2